MKSEIRRRIFQARERSFQFDPLIGEVMNNEAQRHLQQVRPRMYRPPLARGPSKFKAREMWEIRRAEYLKAVGRKEP